MQKKIVSAIALVLAFLMVSSVFVSAEFGDVSKYKEEIKKLNELRIVQGKDKEETVFAPDENVTRWQMALLISKMSTSIVDDVYDNWYSEENGTHFTDVKKDHFTKSIAYAAENGIIIGRSETTFDPDGGISYQDALTMLVRTLGYGSETMDKGYPESYINKAMELGLIEGFTDKVGNNDTLTRGMTAKLIYNCLYANKNGGGKFINTFEEKVTSPDPEPATSINYFTCDVSRTGGIFTIPKYMYDTLQYTGDTAEYLGHTWKLADKNKISLKIFTGDTYPFTTWDGFSVGIYTLGLDTNGNGTIDSYYMWMKNTGLFGDPVTGGWINGDTTIYWSESSGVRHSEPFVMTVIYDENDISSFDIVKEEAIEGVGRGFTYKLDDKSFASFKKLATNKRNGKWRLIDTGKVYFSIVSTSFEMNRFRLSAYINESDNTLFICGVDADNWADAYYYVSTPDLSTFSVHLKNTRGKKEYNGPAAPIRIACIGDSITLGAGASDWEKCSYPANLQKLLGDNYIVGKFGYGGSTYTKNWQYHYNDSSYYEASTAFNPDIVISMFGTNDANIGSSVQTFINDATELLKHYENLPSNPIIFVCTSPKEWVASYTYLENTIVPLTRELAADLGYNLIEVFDVMKHHKELLTSDLMHPNDEGYVFLAQLIYDGIIDTLKEMK